MKNKTKIVFIITGIISTFFLLQCDEKIPYRHRFDFHRSIKGQVIDYNTKEPIKEAEIRIWIDNSGNPSGYGYEDTLLVLTDDFGYYLTERIRESLWLTGTLRIEASKKPNYIPLRWNSNNLDGNETSNKIWERDTGDTLEINFGLSRELFSFSIIPLELDFHNNIISLQIVIINDGSGLLDWEVSTNDNLISYQLYGAYNYEDDFTHLLEGGWARLNFEVNRELLNPGNYTKSIIFTTNAGIAVIPVYITVE